MSYEHAGKIEAQLKAEVAELLAKAEAADQTDVPDGISIPEELAEHEARLAAREAKTAATGKKPGGRPPQPPVEGPLPNDQINLTDEDSRIMPVAGGFEQCYNAQAAVAADSLLVVAVTVTQAPNDKQQIEPILDKLNALPGELGEADTLLADTGYFSAANVAACEAAGIDPLIAMGRQPHHPPLGERFGPDPLPPENPTPVEAMAHRLKTREGRDLHPTAPPGAGGLTPDPQFVRCFFDPKAARGQQNDPRPLRELLWR